MAGIAADMGIGVMRQICQTINNPPQQIAALQVLHDGADANARVELCLSISEEFDQGVDIVLPGGDQFQRLGDPAAAQQFVKPFSQAGCRACLVGPFTQYTDSSQPLEFVWTDPDPGDRAPT